LGKFGTNPWPLRLFYKLRITALTLLTRFFPSKSGFWPVFISGKKFLVGSEGVGHPGLRILHITAFGRVDEGWGPLNKSTEHLKSLTEVDIGLKGKKLPVGLVKIPRDQICPLGLFKVDGPQ
jgi:hypothetical protein